MFDPISLGLGGAQMLGGVLQTVFSGKKKAERNLERLANSYQKNPSIMDYYTKSLNNYNANPYSSASYQQATKEAQRGQSAGINALGDRRSVLSGLPQLVTATNSASLRAASNAERERQGQLNTLGRATEMKAREDKYPFELKYNMLAQKAAGANAQKSAGWRNIFGGLGTAATGYTSGNKNKTTPTLNNGWMTGNKNEEVLPPIE